jgi:site-specific DNA-methyltransferase (adenine-specific)
MWVFGSTRMFLEHFSEFSGWKLSQDIVWEKHNGSGFFNDRFRRVHETVLHFYRDDAQWGDVFKAPQFTTAASTGNFQRDPRPR